MNWTNTIQQIATLDSDCCTELAKRVRDMKSRWIKRDERELYTLGAAAYLDAPDPRTTTLLSLPSVDNKQYYALAKQTNALLSAEYPEVYTALSNTLAQTLRAEVVFASKCALPGFHIFGPSPTYSSPQSHLPHVDRQYRALDWPASTNVDFAGAISFTLPIELPQDGGGLKLWELDLFNVSDWDKERAREKIRAARSQRYSYTVGEMIIHRGHSLHQIAPWSAKPDEYRITIQGHGLQYGDCWNLYW